MGPFDSLISLDTLLAICIALISGILHGYSGFGGALLMVPLLSFFIEPVFAVAVTIIAVFIGQIPLAWQAVRSAQWTECGPFLVAAIIGLPFGAYLLIAADADIVRRLIGMTTLMAASVLLTGWTYRGNRNIGANALFGGLSGVVNGATGQGGPLVVVYFVSAPVDAELQRANIITAITGLIFFTLVSLAIGGVMPSDIVVLGVGLGVPYVFGTWFGNRLFGLLPKTNYRRATLILLFAAGLSALIK